MNINVDSSEISTIRLALMAWINRCKAEAKVMLELAEDYAPGSENNLKCIRNAAASDNFKAEAETILSKL